MIKLKIKNDKSTKNTLINIGIWLVLSLIIAYFGEKTGQPSSKIFYTFIKERPGLFLVDYAIILFFTSFAFLFTRTRAVLFINYIIVIAGYVAQRILLTFRGTPFSWSDIYSMNEGMAMAGTYGLTKYILPGILAIALVAGAVVFLVKTEPNHSKIKVIKLSGIPIVILSLFLPSASLAFAAKLGTPAQVYDWDVGTTYSYNGFMYSFLNSKTSFKVEIPESYTEENVKTVMETLTINENDNYNEDTESPNVIFIQIESFLDPNRIKEIEVINDPIPTIRQLLSDYTSGLVQVPTFGAQTVRSEFEALTGMSTDYLPAYSIPNNNVLQKGAVESLAQIFNNSGYTSSLVHNFTGGFYDRDIVYRNFGFDYFVSKEYMDMPENYGVSNYPEDVLNMDTMKEVLGNASTPQFIYNVTVESHGSYSTDYEYDTLDFTGYDLTETEKCQLQDFFDKLKGVDEYIKQLIEYVNTLERPTVIAMFSDHLPSMEVINRSDSSIEGGDRYLTEAIVYDNLTDTHEKENIDLELYQFGSYVIDRYNLPTGIMPTLHSTYKDSEDYDAAFELIQYDMLYGKKYYNDGTNLYSKADTVFGLKDIVLDSYYIVGDTAVIKGQNFNYLSKAAIDNKIITSTYVVDENTMNVSLEDMKSGTLTINQMSVVGSNVKSLSSSNSLKFKKK